MPLMRNPFRSARNPADHWSDENGMPIVRNTADGGYESTSIVDRKSSDITVVEDQKQPMEFQLSEIDEKGTFIPPSEPEKRWLGSLRSFGSSTSTSTRSTTTRNAFDENEPFNISRESFDSYRRSFDISARSPVMTPETFRPRQSLDARLLRLPSSTLKEPAVPQDPPQEAVQDEEERFEDVGLDDPVKPAKRSFLSRFGGSTGGVNAATAAVDQADSSAGRPASSGSHGFFGRKKAAHEAEMASMGKPVQSRDVKSTPTPDVQPASKPSQ